MPTLHIDHNHSLCPLPPGQRTARTLCDRRVRTDQITKPVKATCASCLRSEIAWMEGLEEALHDLLETSEGDMRVEVAKMIERDSDLILRMQEALNRVLQ